MFFTEIYLMALLIFTRNVICVNHNHQLTEFYSLIILLLTISIVLRLITFVSGKETGYLQVCLGLIGTSGMLAMSYPTIEGKVYDIYTGLWYALVLASILFVVGRIGLHRKRIVGLVSVCVIPGLLVATRVSGYSINGSYLSIGSGFPQTIGLVVLLLPFAVTYLVRCQIDFPSSWLCKVKILKRIRIPLNQVILLGFTFLILFLAGIINHEYGTVLICAGLSAIMFLRKARSLRSKFLFAAVTIIGAIFTLSSSIKLRNRFLVAWDLKTAITEAPADALPIKYLYDNIFGAGLYGYGRGSLALSVYNQHAALSDYVITTTLYSYGVIFALLLIALTFLMIVKVYRCTRNRETDRMIQNSIIIILLMFFLISIGGNFGVIPLAGIPFPFLGTAKSLNATFFAFLVFLLALPEKETDLSNIEYRIFSWLDSKGGEQNDQRRKKGISSNDQ